MRRVVFTVHGDPSQGRINGRAKMRAVGRSGERRIGKSDAYRGYMTLVANAARTACRESGVRFASGTLVVAISLFFPKRVDPNNKTRKTPLPEVPDDLPNTDVDAPVKCILDGLQLGSLVDDDVRIVELHVRKGVSKERPRAVVSVQDSGRRGAKNDG